MNKIVLEHYPTNKLPDDIKSALKGVESVKITLEGEKKRGLSRDDLLALMNKPMGKSANSVDGIRAGRNEWD